MSNILYICIPKDLVVIAFITFLMFELLSHILNRCNKIHAFKVSFKVPIHSMLGGYHFFSV